MTNKIITQFELKQLLHYDHVTGLFIRKKDNSKPGGKDGYGYIDIYINHKKYKAHRLAWLYVYGEWPKGEIDHINGLKDDNRIANLRQCTHKQNRANTDMQAHNSSGFKGVVPVPSRGIFKAQIRINGIAKHLGYFNTAIAASDAYEIEAIKVYGEFHKKRGSLYPKER